MARKPTRKQPVRPQTSSHNNSAQSNHSGSNGDPVVAAFMALLAERRFEDIGFAEVARRAGVSLSDVRMKHASKIEMLAAYMRDVDRVVLDGIDSALADEPPRERLFDVLMRRLEVLAPHKAAVRSLTRSAMRNPPLAFALNGLTVQSQQWMLTAADIGAAGPRGMVRAQGLAVLFASVLRTWVDDDDPGLARTMAALDRALARGQRWSGFLDGALRMASCAGRGRSRRRRRDADDETVAA